MSHPQEDICSDGEEGALFRARSQFKDSKVKALRAAVLYSTSHRVGRNRGQTAAWQKQQRDMGLCALSPSCSPFSKQLEEILTNN